MRRAVSIWQQQQQQCRCSHVGRCAGRPLFAACAAMSSVYIAKAALPPRRTCRPAVSSLVRRAPGHHLPRWSSACGAQTRYSCYATATTTTTSAATEDATQPVEVETSETPNPDCLRFFSMDISFLNAGFSLDLPSAEHAYKSPLAQELFALDGVVALFLADEYVTVRKKPEVNWDDLIPAVKDVILDFAASGQSVLSAEGEAMLIGYNGDTEPDADDDEVVLAVKELLATRIRPMLRADGGNVRYVDMDDGTVFLLLEGACKACPSSHITLKSGIERMLMHWIPEVVEAQEVTEEIAQDMLAEKKLRRDMKARGETIKAE